MPIIKVFAALTAVLVQYTPKRNIRLEKVQQDYDVNRMIIAHTAGSVMQIAVVKVKKFIIK
jgi:hypothetical protein